MGILTHVNPSNRKRQSANSNCRAVCMCNLIYLTF